MKISALPFNRQFDPKNGTPVDIAQNVVRITASNSSPYTFTGTNTYILGKNKVAIIDPGPNEGQHLLHLLNAINDREVVAIILTHTHKDHCALARRLQQKTGAPLWFGGKHRLSRPKHFLEINKLQLASDWNLTPDRLLEDGQTIKIDNIELEVIATPGHCANHLCFGIVGTPYIFTGDHVMGWNSTMVATPDGSMADYLKSLDRLIAAPYTHYFPGHGGAIKDLGEKNNGRSFAHALKTHRLMRNAQIIEAIESGADSVSQIVKQIYPDAGAKIRLAAGMIIEAHIEYLADKGRVRLQRGFGGKTRLSIPENAS
ncbi:MBL-fold metallo-hydrolase superfamily [hydrothermal vent metagenome]|uniref:MBL-fold metallo-hydrolase superfamily n=1 Tax=hydrothermal vent metagenome TaxID=652676 RepID=A0A3B0U747_9ZZZZ